MIKRNKRGQSQIAGLYIKYLGIDFYKLLLNLLLLAVLGFIIWSGIQLFSHNFLSSPLIGSLVFISELIMFILLCKHIRSNRWRPPSVWKTAIVLAIISIILAFAGVQPLANYKEKSIDYITGYFKEIKANREASLEQIKIENEEKQKAEEIKKEQELENQKIAAQEAQETQEQEFQAKLIDMEHEVLLIVNLIRSDKGIEMLQWDDKLYIYSKSHSEEMANTNHMFHTDMNQSYAENCWMGSGAGWEAIDIVNGWMDSPKHRTWLLCPNLKRVAVGIVYSGSNTFASWTFWRNETSDSDWWYQYTPDNPPPWWY